MLLGWNGYRILSRKTLICVKSFAQENSLAKSEFHSSEPSFSNLLGRLSAKSGLCDAIQSAEEGFSSGDAELYLMILEGAEETIKKFSGTERISPDKWVIVSFMDLDENQTVKVNETANYLGIAGMRFDTSGHRKLRDWELDWSFIYTGKEDEEWREARDWVEDEINNLPTEDE